MIERGDNSEAGKSVAAGEDIESAPVFVCPVCGHTVIGEAPTKCPICGVPKKKYRQFWQEGSVTIGLTLL